MQKRTIEDWQKLFSEHAQSGQSEAAFCRARGLCARHFSKRRKQLIPTDAVTSSGTMKPTSAFVPAIIDRDLSSCVITLRWGDALELTLPLSVSPAWVKGVVNFALTARRLTTLHTSRSMV